MRSGYPFFSTARPTERMVAAIPASPPAGGPSPAPARSAARGGAGGNSSKSSPWRTSSTRPGGASASSTPWLTAVQVTAHSASASFSRFSHSGIVQMSFAWAEQVQRRPVRRAA